MAEPIITLRDDRDRGGWRVRVAFILAPDPETRDRIALIRQGFSHAEARKLAKLKAAARSRGADSTEGE